MYSPYKRLQMCYKQKGLLTLENHLYSQECLWFWEEQSSKNEICLQLLSDTVSISVSMIVFSCFSGRGELRIVELAPSRHPRCSSASKASSKSICDIAPLLSTASKAENVSPPTSASALHSDGNVGKSFLG